MSENPQNAQGPTRRSVLAGLATVPFATWLAACTSSSGNNSSAGAPTGSGAATSGGAPVTLSIEDWFNGKVAQVFEPAMKTLRPKVSLSEQKTPFSNYEQKVITQLSSGTAPDVLALDVSFNGDIFPTGLLVSFNDALKSANVNMSKWTSGLDRGYTYNGQILGLPLQAFQQLIVYVNKNNAGSLADEAPVMGTSAFDTWHWDKFVAWAKEGTKTGSDGSVKQYGVTLGDANTLLKGMVASLGGQLLDDQYGYNETKCLLDSDAVVQAAQLITDLVRKHKVAPSPSADSAIPGGIWLAGKAMTMINWADPTIYPVAQTFPQIQFQLPYVDKKSVGVGYNYLAVPKSSKNVEAAIDWIITLTTSGAGTAAILEGIAPPAFNTLEVVKAAADGPAKQFAEIELSRLGAKDLVLFPRWDGRYAGGLMETEIANALEKTFEGKASVKDAFTTAAHNVNAQIATKRKQK